MWTVKDLSIKECHNQGKIKIESDRQDIHTDCLRSWRWCSRTRRLRSRPLLRCRPQTSGPLPGWPPAICRSSGTRPGVATKHTHTNTYGMTWHDSTRQYSHSKSKWIIIQKTMRLFTGRYPAESARTCCMRISGSSGTTSPSTTGPKAMW